LIIEKQEYALKLIRDGVNLFLTGSGGVGKSHVIRQVLDDDTILCAPTGIAAINIGGVTCHSTFALPLHYPLLSDWGKVGKAFKEIFGLGSNIKRIIIDEAGMLRAEQLDIIDHRLKLVRRNKKPFGGLQLVLVGDFFQLEPIVSKQDKLLLDNEYQSPFCFHSRAWNFKTVELTDVVRQSDKTQVELLNAIRKGSDTAGEALATIQANALPYVNEASTLHLCAYNQDAEAINHHWYSQIMSPEKVYKAVGKENGCGVSELLKLKVGTKVIISANDNESGYTNGERGTVERLFPNAVEVRKDNGDLVNVIPFTWEKYKLQKVDGKYKHVIDSVYIQLPLKLGWAISIHKSQGMTLEKAAIDVGKGCFSNGQLYVALSRLKDLNNISFVTHVGEKNIKTSEHVKEFYLNIS
jgi:ATP-dependent DNA helicase PIF1